MWRCNGAPTACPNSAHADELSRFALCAGGQTRPRCTIAGIYRFAVEEAMLEDSPAVHVRRPRSDYESHAIGLDRSEARSLLVVAVLGAPKEHALISLLTINGLRISEARGADIDALGSSAATRTRRCCVEAARSSPSRSRREPRTTRWADLIAT